MAAMDISDGLIADLGHMCATSKVRAQVQLDDVPFSAAASVMIATDAAFFEAAITGGDDYEILAAVLPENAASFEAALQAAGLSCARIGELLKPDSSQPAIALSLNGKAYTLHGAGGYTHF